MADIKFNPAKILEASVSLKRQHTHFNQCVTNIKKKADILRVIWQGDSAALYAEKMKELDIQSVETAKKILALSKDLANVSGIYKTSESAAKQKAEALPTEGVFLV